MRILTAAACLAGALFVVNSAEAGNRIAFVVGNGAYKFVQPLPNPTIDAKSMSTLLRNAGFEVVEGTDLGREGMTSRLREFATKSQGADVAVFYYAGHGISVNGKNYLIPVDADLKSEMDVMFGAAIDVDVTLDQTMSDSKVKVVLLDACRDNPFAAKIRSAARTRAVTVNSGLAEMKSAEGTLIAFATSPGQTALDGHKGGNSPFTKALLNHIATPGVELQQAMTRVRAQVNEETQKAQLPWGHTNLIGSVYINTAAAPAAPVVSASPTADSPAGDSAATTVVAAVNPGSAAGTVARSAAPDVEIEFWRSIKDTNKPEELNAYLLNYPSGQFRPLALARLAAIDAQQKTPSVNTTKTVDPATFTAEATQATEDSIGLDRRKRSQVQRQLNNLGFDTRSSGKFDEETRSVITRWQTARGYPASGFFNKLQVSALMNERAAKSARQDDDVEESRPARSERRRGGRRHAGGGGGGRRQSGGGFGAPPPIFNVLGGFGRR